MIKIQCDEDGAFSVLDGDEEFQELIDAKGCAEVVDAETGIQYFAHQIGKDILLLSMDSQTTLENMTSAILHDIARKPPLRKPSS